AGWRGLAPRHPHTRVTSRQHLARTGNKVVLADVHLARHGNTTLRALASTDLVKPALQRRQVTDIDTGPGMGSYPAPVGDIGNAVITSQKLVVLQLRVQHGKQALAFALVALDGGRNFLREVTEEYIRLPHHRPDAPHLEHQPLDHARAPLRSEEHTS